MCDTDRDGRGSSLSRRRGPTWRRPEGQAEVHVIRRRSEELAIKSGRIPSALDREHHERGGHVGADRVQPELECGRDPEVRARSTEAPEQLGVIVVAHVA